MLDLEKALKIVLRETPVKGSELVKLEQACGRILAEDVVTDRDMPPFDRSQMDGYALVSEDNTSTPLRLKIVGESAAGKGWNGILKKSFCVRIMTGARVPAGADSVQKLELVKEENGFATFLEKPNKGQFIVKKGAEIKKGKVVLQKGDKLTPFNISCAASFGKSRIRVAKKPKLAIIATGTEIVPVNKTPLIDQIRNSNSSALSALSGSFAADCVIEETAGDDIKDIIAKLKKAAKAADIIITTGGVSVGKYDLTKAALKEIKAEIFFDKVCLKPGKPTVFARRGDRLFFGLPGNPVSAIVTFLIFVRAAIMKMQAARQVGLRERKAILAKEAKAAAERDTFLPGLTFTDDAARLCVNPVSWIGSSDFIGLARSNALIYLPRGTKLNTGDLCKIYPLEEFA
ncbi:MAG TPA: gephyrin-like molybdotransferase Glp [Pyrinomonadaceae bacterium]|nr:gephyrin-like molybdotransferase Glp [Pyrinomonadaceae bacterium]